MKRTLFAALSALLLSLLTLPAQTAEQPKEYIFKGLPNYELYRQERNFNKLKIRTPKPESTEYIETTYEGNLVVSEYRYDSGKGGQGNQASCLQILRHYENSAKKLGGETLFDASDKSSFSFIHSSFTRNDKQFYMEAMCVNQGGNISVKILEIAKMADDSEIIDADTIVHKLEKEGSITLYINFDTGKATVKPESKGIVDEIVTALKSKPNLKVKLEGHTDNVGNASANKKLSDDRAKAVMNAIAAKGIDKARLSAEGFGQEKPIADNNTEEGRAKNRRVELVKVR